MWRALWCKRSDHLAQALKGFPVAANMCHDDRLWLFASVMGCLGLLRGASEEFLVSPKLLQSRPVLRGREVFTKEVVDLRWAVIVWVPKPKARWWEPHMPVTIFGLPGTPLDVVQLLLDYRNSAQVIQPCEWRMGHAVEAAHVCLDDRLWLFASVLGCLGLLRGGEFLVSAKQTRPILRGVEINITEVVAGRRAVVVNVPKPKARWWEPHIPVTVFGLPGTPLDVVRLCEDYRNLSVVALGPNDPAMRLASGETLSKSWMFARTESKLSAAGVYLVDEIGRPAPIGAKAWRYGGSASHDAARVAPKVKQARGRWLSSAVLCYAPPPQSEDFLQATKMIWNEVVISGGGGKCTAL